MNIQATGEDLIKYFEHENHRMIHKWYPYFEIYERHLAHFRDREIAVLEIGVYHGGSLQMWKHYFGPRAKIYGLDIDERCATLTEDGIEILIADSGNKEQLQAIKDKLPPFDIIIDDGGHTMEQQIVALQELFWHMNDGGVYICEDTHTSYKKDRTPGFRDKYSFMEYTKFIIDQLNAWHSEFKEIMVDDHTRHIFGMHYYDSMVVFEKREHPAPQHRIFGTPSFPLTADEKKMHYMSSQIPKITKP